MKILILIFQHPTVRSMTEFDLIEMHILSLQKRSTRLHMSELLCGMFTLRYRSPLSERFLMKTTPAARSVLMITWVESWTSTWNCNSPHVDLVWVVVLLENLVFWNRRNENFLLLFWASSAACVIGVWCNSAIEYFKHFFAICRELMEEEFACHRKD